MAITSENSTPVEFSGIPCEYPDICTQPPKCPAENCGEVFPFRYQLEWHHLWRHRAQVHVCSECNSTFGDDNELKIHHRTHSVDNGLVRHTCEKCGVVFESEIKLRLHHLEHAKPKIKYGCKRCQRTFKDQMSLTDHMVSHAERLQAKNSCNGCFSRKSFRINHKSRNSALECQYVACLTERVCQHGNARTLSL